MFKIVVVVAYLFWSEPKMFGKIIDAKKFDGAITSVVINIFFSLDAGISKKETEVLKRVKKLGLEDSKLSPEKILFEE